MNMVLQQLRQFGLVPIVTINKAEYVRPLAQALLKAGLPVLEITFRTQAAEEGLRIISREFPEIVLGAGTILTPENAQKATDAGAKFLLAPGFNPRVVDYCIEHDITIVPGINSPTQIELALEKGIRVLKFFPSESSGGIGHISSMAAPFSDIHFIATGGIRNSNLASYIAYPGILACGGSWLASGRDIESGRFDDITAAARNAIRIMLGFAVKSIEVPGVPKKEIIGIEHLFGGVLHQPVKINEEKIEVNDIVCFSHNSRDLPGTIVMETNDCGRAYHYLKQQGIAAELTINETGREVIGIKEAPGGYCIRIVKK